MCKFNDKAIEQDTNHFIREGSKVLYPHELYVEPLPIATFWNDDRGHLLIDFHQNLEAHDVILVLNHFEDFKKELFEVLEEIGIEHDEDADLPF